MRALTRLVVAGFLTTAAGCALGDMCGPEDRRVAVGGEMLDSAQAEVGYVGVSLLQTQVSTAGSLVVAFWSNENHEPSPLVNHVVSARLMRADSVVLDLPPTVFSAADNYLTVPSASTEEAVSLWEAFQRQGLQLVLTTDVSGMQSLSIPLHLRVLENWHKHPCD